MLLDNIEFFILCFSSLFALINPIGIVPIFISITENFSQNKINKIAIKSILFSMVILILFSFIGDLIFSFYGITIHAFRIAGGILLLKISLDMIESKRTRTRTTPVEQKEAEDKDDVAYTPLGIPLIAGPGSIASIMMLSSESNEYTQKIILLFALILVLIITFVIFKLSKFLSKKLGKSGLRIIQRLMGLILMVISIEFILKGIQETVQTWNL